MRTVGGVPNGELVTNEGGTAATGRFASVIQHGTAQDAGPACPAHAACNAVVA